MSNSLPLQDNPRGPVVNRAPGRSLKASATRSRLSVRNLFFILMAAVGLSIVPVGVANALPTAATSAGSNCRVGDTDYYQSSVENLDGGEYLCQSGTLQRQGGDDPFDGSGVPAPFILQ